MSPISRGFRGRRREVDPSRVPPGQYTVDDFPVLSAGPTPHTPLDEWSLTERTFRRHLGPLEAVGPRGQLEAALAAIMLRQMLASRPNASASPKTAGVLQARRKHKRASGSCSTTAGMNEVGFRVAAG